MDALRLNTRKIRFVRREQPLLLVVDDDEALRVLLREVLFASGFQVIEAGNGEEALAQYQQHQPDLVLLDILMPLMDGYETCSRLRRISKSMPLPILMLTAMDDVTTVARAYQAGATDFCIKPLNPVLLVEKVRNALRVRDTEIDLLEHKNKLSHSQRLAGMGYWECDLATGRVRFSEELCDLFGFRDCQLIVTLEDFFRFVHPDDRASLQQVLRHAQEETGAFAVEHRMIDQDGVEYIVQHQGEITDDEPSVGPFLVATLIDITDRRDAESLIEKQHFFDKLTGLPNRILFTDKLAHLMSRTEEDECLMGVLFMGIDRFKHINDTLGHSLGDELLRQIASRLEHAHDSIELAARFSGDIFSFVITGATSVPGIDQIAERIVKLFADPFHLDQQEFFLSVSVGCAVFPFHDDSREALIRLAESAMFQAKNAGGNRYVRFSAEIDHRATRRLSLETSLRRAIERDEFRVYYQPQVSVQNQRIIGMEALVRWERPGMGLIAPDEFIPIAEETGLIIPIGAWVMDTAARQVADWMAMGYGLLRVGINLSARQFEERRLLTDIQDLIARVGIPPCCLDVEITESSAMHNLEGTIATLQGLMELGVQASMDDFGTGYSSLSYLHKIPLQTLKIDRAFISKISDRGEHGELAKVIISMCQALGLNVIAEGVETAGQMRFLRRFGCSEAQGYYISRPVSAGDFTLLLSENQALDVSGDERLAFF